jgi:phage terminase large subunit-like protein
MTKKREPIFVNQNLTTTTRAPKSFELDAKKRELQLIQRQERIYHCLPHLYGYKWYHWSKAFFENRHKVALLTAGNQLSKSSTMIRKCIDWATDKSKWKELWPNHDAPRLFWYFYPTLTVATTEVETKWIPEFLPRDEFRDDPTYGWKIYYDKKGVVDEIHFNSGVVLQFKAYSMAAQNLQTSTVYWIGVDEELPMHLYDELMFRLHATEGYFNSVFTATIGQEFWRACMEERGTDQEKLPDAYKVQVSAYDCQYYIDGTPSPWTAARIEAAKSKCRNESEVQKRIYGKFVMDEGLKITTFSPSKHVITPFPVTDSFQIYAGVDVGSGGSNHPAAIVFIALAPNARAGYVFKAWRGDNLVTTASDILDKYNELSKDLNVVMKFADPRATDFHNIAIRAGTPFTKPDSKHEVGESVLGTLFGNDMLFLFQDSEINKLGTELMSLSSGTPKTIAKDDLYDALRYTCVSIPWDWQVIGDKLSEKDKTKPIPPQETEAERQIRERRGERLASDKTTQDWEEDFQAEIDEYNSLAEEF